MTGTRIRLPHYDALPEGVYFHQEFPGEKRLVVQIPNEDRTDSETYVLDLEDTIHAAWLDGLKNSRNLTTTLGWAKHLAYCPRTGYFEEMPDLDEPTDASKKIAQARKEASYEQTNDQMLTRLRRRRVPPPSKLRRALAGRRRGGRL